MSNITSPKYDRNFTFMGWGSEHFCLVNSKQIISKSNIKWVYLDKTDVTHYPANLELHNKGRLIK